jgi:serine/threonine protein kinase
MWGIVLVAGAILALILLVVWIVRTGFLLHTAGVDPQFVQTVPDRVRYTSMGGIVLLTAIAATASLTVALSLVFPGHGWLPFLPVGMLWGAIVLNFDRWIVSSLDYGPLTAEEAGAGQAPRKGSKAVHFLVRFTMAALVGLVISEPIVLAIFGPEIKQQLNAQHVTDISQQTAQINAAANRQIAVVAAPVASARAALAAATRNATKAHTIYICELTAKCHLPQGEITGVPGPGPQTAQDFLAWRAAVRQENNARQALSTATAAAQGKISTIRAQATAKIGKATAAILADNGLLARERALDTLSRQNPGFFLRRMLLWLALMFIDLAPVLLKTFSPPTLSDHLQRSAAVKLARNATPEAVADSDHESQKRAITREHDLEYHQVVVAADYRRRMVEADAEPPANGAALVNGAGPVVANLNGFAAPNGQHRTWRRGGENGDGVAAGWVIGGRWLVKRPLIDMSHSGRVPLVAADLRREYPFEVVVKIIAPPPRAEGPQALRERRHAQMEMSLPLGHIHDNLAEVLDCDLDPEHGFYIVTRLYPQTLEGYLREAVQQDSLTLGQVLTIAVQTLAGLRAAWDRGFVHLDLKPANVALAEDGTVKLIDFGLAQQYQQVNGGNDTTTAARFTPFYAPPEQMERRDSSWISRNADIRALGAVLYRMLTGFPPLFREALAIGLVDASGRYRYESYDDIRHLVRSVEPVGVGELVSYLPEDLDMLVRQWLRIDPQMRCPGTPATMAERAWLQLAAVHERAQASAEASFLVGPRVVHEPRTGRLVAQWRARPAGGGRAWPGPAQSGDTVEGAPAGLVALDVRDAETVDVQAVDAGAAGPGAFGAGVFEAGVFGAEVFGPRPADAQAADRGVFGAEVFGPRPADAETADPQVGGARAGDGMPEPGGGVAGEPARWDYPEREGDT